MKTRRILSLLLAVLMIVTALPLTLMVAAQEAAVVSDAEATAPSIVSGPAGAAPATLPDGDYYTTSDIFSDDSLYFNKSTNHNTWLYSFASDALASTNCKGLNEGVGVMFKADASAIAAGTDKLSLYFGMYATATINGTDKGTVLMSNVGALGYFQGQTTKPTGVTTSTWYYSVDGKMWNAITSSAASFATIADRTDIYFYIPYSSMYFSYGESYFKTGTAVSGEPGLSFADATEIVGGWKRANGGFKIVIGNNSMGDAHLSNFSFVYKSDVVPTLPNGDEYTTSSLFLKDTVFSKTSNLNAWVYPDAPDALVSTDCKGLNEGVGIMFKADASAIAEGTDNLSFYFGMYATATINGADKSGHLMSNIGSLGYIGGSSTKPAGTTSTWYYSLDGRTWTEISSTATYFPTMAHRKEVYFYIPYSSMYFSQGETFFKTGTAASGEPGLSFEQATEIVGSWKRANGGFKLSFGSGTNAMQSASLSDFSFVYKVDNAPKLPNGDYYTTSNIFSDDSVYFNKTTNHNAWVYPSASDALASTNCKGLNEGVGIMFKMDASTIAAGGDNLSLYFGMYATATINGNDKSTLLMSNVGALGYLEGKTTKPTGVTTSTWYYSFDCKTWTAITSSAASFPTVSDRAEVYFYIPYSSMYFSYGETYFKTGTASTEAEPGLSFADATEIVGGWKRANGGFKIKIGDTAMGDACLNQFSFVYKSDVPSVVPTVEKLPVVGQTLTTPFMQTNSIRPNYNQSASYSGNMYPTASANLAAADGVMFELDTTQMSGFDPLQLSFLLSAKNGNEIIATVSRSGRVASTIDPSATSTWYWSEDGINWKAYTSNNATAQCMTLNTKSTKAYVYIPFTSFWSRYDRDYISGVTNASDSTKPCVRGDEWLELMRAQGKLELNYIHGFYGTGAKSAAITLENLSFVQLDRTMEDATKAPNTLPDGKEYAAVPMFKSEFNEQVYDAETTWQDMKVFAPAMVPATLEYANGVMMKVDTSNVEPGTDVAGLSFALAAYMSNGNSTYICSSVGLAASYGQAASPSGATSTWYISNDGKNWTAISGTTVASTISAQRGILYLYIPTSSMYVRCGETFLKTGEHGADETVVPYTEANAIVGGFTKFDSVNIMMTKNTVSQSMTVSEISLVGTPLRVFQSASISMTDDLAYNLYVKMPEGAQDVKMEFAMGGKTFTVEGIQEENGLIRYTVSNIYPQQLGEVLTMTWTATVDGVPQVETYTDSILLYLRKVLNDDAYSSWHDLAKALLHYGDAAQTYTGEESTYVNSGIGATLAPVHIDQLPYTLINNAPEIWTTAALRLESSINLKIGVNAPAGVTRVRYTVGDRTGTVSIQDGYAYIPVYAYELLEPVTLNLVSSSQYGSYVISASAYIKKQFESTEDENLKAILQTIANYAQEATLLKGDRLRATIATPTLTQIELVEGGGMAYVIQLTDGRFIVIDGGTNDDANMSNLWTYLVEKSGYTKPVIAMWMFTHQHADHVTGAFEILQTNWQKMEVQGFAYSWVTEDQLAVDEGDYNEQAGNTGLTHAEYKASEWEWAEARQKEFDEQIRLKYPNATYWDMKRGDVQMIGDVQVKILLDASETYRDDVFELNDFSAAWKMTFTQGTDATTDDKSFLVLGDCSTDRLEELENNHAADLDCDVLQATHHGLEGGVKSTYEKVTPTISLISTREDAFTKDKLSSYYLIYYLGDFNKYLRNNSTVYYNDQAPVIDMGTLATTLWGNRSAIKVVMTTPGD